VRDEYLKQHWFTSLEQAQTVIKERRVDSNTKPPHSSFDNQTPQEFASKCALIQDARSGLEFSLRFHPCSGLDQNRTTFGSEQASDTNPCPILSSELAQSIM
jgi:hypothetical protein